MKARLGYLAAGLATGIALCLGVQRAMVKDIDEEHSCDISVKPELSPNKQFRATLTNKVCAWGFGQAANLSSLKLEKLGDNGFFENIDLETDQPVSEPPTMHWSSQNELEVVIKSYRSTGSVQVNEQGLRFTRAYVSTK